MKTDEKKKNHARSTTYEVCSIFLWSTAGETYEVLGVHTMYVRRYERTNPKICQLAGQSK